MEYLSDLGLILTICVLLIICVPLTCRVGVALLFKLTGVSYFAVVLGVAGLIWLLFGIIVYK